MDPVILRGTADDKLRGTIWTLLGILLLMTSVLYALAVFRLSSVGSSSDAAGQGGQLSTEGGAS